MNVQISQEDYNALANLSALINKNQIKIDYCEVRAIELKRELDIANARYQALYGKICKEKRLEPNEQHTFSVAQPTHLASLENDGDPTQ